MQIDQLFLTITDTLTQAGCESPAFDACCILEDFAAMPHGTDPRFCKTSIDPSREQAVLCATARRADGEPLQYILGEWDFLSLTLKVGPGVLIPRPDTELLCETVAEKCRGERTLRVLDLCAGSGCVGLGIASLLDQVSVTSVELSEEALPYLYDNLKRYPMYAVSVVKDDVLHPQQTYDCMDVIVSNPPYIPTKDLDGLMREVQYEPRMALDGEEDGLRFYRQITSYWTRFLKDNGLLCVEIGIGQDADVVALFEEAGLREIEVFCDLAQIPRVVCGRCKKSSKI